MVYQTFFDWTVLLDCLNIKPEFSNREYNSRIGGLQRKLIEAKLDVFVCNNLSNICYLCGFQTIGSYGYGLYSLIVPAKGHPILFTSAFESHNAKLYTWDCELHVYDQGEEIKGTSVINLAELLIKKGFESGRIGIETSHFSMTIEEYLGFKDHLKDAHLVDATFLMEDLKLNKSEEEIDAMKTAAKLTSLGMKAGLDECKMSRTDNDIAAKIYDTIIKNGGEYFSLQPIVTTGRRSGIPHSTFRRNLLKKGDSGIIEVSACYKRYSSPMMRTFAFGSPSDELKYSFEACKVSIESIISNLGPGVSGIKISNEAGRKIRAIKPDLLWHGCYGYSVGLGFPPSCSDVCRTGIISAEKEFIPEAGMIFHISTTLRNIGNFAATCSETVLVTDDGCQVLTDLPRELFVF